MQIVQIKHLTNEELVRYSQLLDGADNATLKEYVIVLAARLEALLDDNK